MRRLRWYGFAVPILLLATACNEPIPGAEKTLAAAEAAGPEAAAEPPASTSTTAVAVTAPPTTAAAPPTTIGRTTTTAKPAPPPPPPPPPTAVTSQVVSPATVTAVTTTVTEGTTTVDLKAVREQYLGERVQVEVNVTSMERIASITVDFGDGHVVNVPQTRPPGLQTQSGGVLRSHVYPAAGRYRITATVTLVPGLAAAPLVGNPAELVWIPTGPEHTVRAAADLLQRPDAAPFPFPRLPPLAGE